MSVAGTMLPSSAPRPGDTSLSAPVSQSVSFSSHGTSKLRGENLTTNWNRPNAVDEGRDVEAAMQELEWAEMSADIASELVEGGE